MKRSLIITVGIVIIFGIIGLWGYLIIYGAPKETQEVFSNLGFISKPVQEVRVVDREAQGKIQDQLGLVGSNLQQITTRAVASFSFVASSSDRLRYVERGTGHVFEINLSTGKETQVSLTTIAQVTEATLSPLGTSVAFTLYEGYMKKVSIGSINPSNSSITLKSLPLNAENIAFKDEKNIYFSVEGAGNTNGYSFNIDTGKWLPLFTVPITDSTSLWGKKYGSKITIETKPTAGLVGYAYSINNSTLTPLQQKGYGLTTLIGLQTSLVSTIEDGKYLTYAIGTTTIKQPIIMLKEKCVFDTRVQNATWCAAPLGDIESLYLEDWYKGAITSNDYLWYTKLNSEQARLVGDLPKLAGKTIDVINMTINTNGTILLFSNKIDQTLWMYKIEK